MIKSFLAAQLMIVSVTRGCGKDIAAVIKHAGAKRLTKIFSPQQEDDFKIENKSTEHDVIMVLLRENSKDVMDSIREEFSKPTENSDSSGMAVTTNVSKFLRRSDISANEVDESTCDINKSENMKSDYTMIISITSHGHAEEIIRTAREAGAKGGTILDARGTCTEGDVKFLGISLAPEREVTIIVSENQFATDILEVLSTQQIFQEKGGGIIFTTDIADLVYFGDHWPDKKKESSL